MGLITDITKQNGVDIPTTKEAIEEQVVRDALAEHQAQHKQHQMANAKTDYRINQDALVAETPVASGPDLEPVCNLQTDTDLTDLVPNIASAAMCVHIEFTKWGGPILDRTVTNEVLADKQAEEGSVVVKKKPLAHSAELKKIENLSNTLRSRGIRHTASPWAGNGWYLLPTANYDDFMETMRKAREEWDTAVDDFLKKYPELVTEAAATGSNPLRGAALYDPTMYPSVESLRREFSMQIHITEVQTTGAAAFHGTLIEAQREAIKDIVAQQNEHLVGKLVATIWDKMREPLLALNAVLDEKHYGGEQKPRYQQAKVNNIIDVSREARVINVGGDTLINAVAAKMETAFVGITVDALKDDSYLRDGVRNTIKTLIDGMPS